MRLQGSNVRDPMPWKTGPSPKTNHADNWLQAKLPKRDLYRGYTGSVGRGLYRVEGVGSKFHSWGYIGDYVMCSFSLSVIGDM